MDRRHWSVRLEAILGFVALLGLIFLPAGLRRL